MKQYAGCFNILEQLIKDVNSHSTNIVYSFNDELDQLKEIMFHLKCEAFETVLHGPNKIVIRLTLKQGKFVEFSKQAIIDTLMIDNLDTAIEYFKDTMAFECIYTMFARKSALQRDIEEGLISMPLNPMY